MREQQYESPTSCRVKGAPDEPHLYQVIEEKPHSVIVVVIEITRPSESATTMLLVPWSGFMLALILRTVLNQNRAYAKYNFSTHLFALYISEGSVLCARI